MRPLYHIAIIATDLVGKDAGPSWLPEVNFRHLSGDARMSYRDLINGDRFPIDCSGTALMRRIEETRKALAVDGCAVLRGFLTREGVEALTGEADAVARYAPTSFNRTNPYFTRDDPELKPTHPKRRFFERSNAFVPADKFLETGALRKIYNAPGFDGFIQQCLQEDRFYRYADPLADVIINVADEGPGFPWHFDTNNFIVTLAIQNAEDGGEFEYAAGIRERDENFDEVSKVLDGTSDRITSIQLQPGDLQLFRGRYSLHRVAPLRGTRPRYVAIISYVEEPNMVATPERAMQLYGKVLPIHYQRNGQRADTFID